jgi:hypothetical protein
MVFSFIDPATCGFARGIAWEISKKLYEDWKFGDSDARSQQKQSCPVTVRYNRFNTVFDCCKENFAIDLKRFQRILLDLRKKFSGWDRRKIHERNQYTATFNIENWKALSASQQGKHTFENCRPCQDRFAAIQALFPVKSTRLIGSSHQKVLSSTDVIDSCINEHATRLPKGCSTKRKAVEIARAVYNRINPSFESICKMPLSSALINVQELNIEEKKSKNEKRKERRNIYRKSKYTTEAEWDKTDVVRYKLLYILYIRITHVINLML